MPNPDASQRSISSAEYSGIQWLFCFEENINPDLKEVDDYNLLSGEIRSEISNFMLFRHRLQNMNPELTQRLKPIIRTTIALLGNMKNCPPDTILDLQEFIDTPVSSEEISQEVRGECNKVLQPHSFTVMCEAMLIQLEELKGGADTTYFRDSVEGALRGIFNKELLPPPSAFRPDQANRIYVLIDQIINLLKDRGENALVTHIEESTARFISMLEKKIRIV